MDDKLLAALASRCDYIPCEIGVCPYHTAIAELSRLGVEARQAGRQNGSGSGDQK